MGTRVGDTENWLRPGPIDGGRIPDGRRVVGASNWVTSDLIWAVICDLGRACIACVMLR